MKYMLQSNRIDSTTLTLSIGPWGSITSTIKCMHSCGWEYNGDICNLLVSNYISRPDHIFRNILYERLNYFIIPAGAESNLIFK